MDYFKPHSFFFELPLYTPIEITERNAKEFEYLMEGNYKIEAYNVSLKQPSSYLVSLGKNHNAGIFFKALQSRMEITCVRNGDVITVYFQTFLNNQEKKFVQKIGQIPSIATLHIGRIKEYHNVLPEKLLREFTKAIGLAANGVGIGSFVYLRRIFEYLIHEAHNQAKSNIGWDETEFSQSRMTEKIELLKGHLPEFLVSKKLIYGILSKGIHELDEDECLTYFEAIKVGIELILDERVEKHKRDLRLQEAKRNIDHITSKLTNK